MDAKALYERRLDGGTIGLLARALSYVYLRLRPPAAYDEHASEAAVFRDHVPATARVLLLGSNVAPPLLAHRGYRDAVQLDIKAYEHVDVVADAESMSSTLAAGSFDYVVSTSMVEHTRRPWLVFSEAFCVLDEGGILYLDAPWIYPLHGEPHDYYRFSEDCLRHLAEDAGFEILDSGANVSGHGALVIFLRSYLSEALAFDRSVAYHIWQYLFGWMLFPFGYLERAFTLRHRAHRTTDAIVYVVARKADGDAGRPDHPGRT